MNKREKKFETLEDIDRDISSRRGRGRGRTSADKRKRTAGFAWFDLQDSLREHGRLLVIPAICMVLIAIVMLLDRGAQRKVEPVASTQEVQPVEQTAAAEPKIALRRCEIPEINMLASEYFDARLRADADTLYKLFNKSLTQGKADAEEKLRAQNSWIQSFGDIKVYELPGLEKDARLIFITYLIDFRRTDTKAPGIMYCYAVKNADGEYVFSENLMKDQIAYIDEMLKRDDVEELKLSVNNALSNALNKDSTLALIYTSFVNGEIYKEYNFEVDKDHEVDLFLNPEDSNLVPSDYDGGEFASENFSEVEAEVESEEEAEPEISLENDAE